MTRYRFETTDGQVHESTAAPSQIAAAHPGAVLTHTVETDEVTGESTLTAYEGEQPVAPEGDEIGENATGPTGATGMTGPTGMTAPAQDDQTAQPTQESSAR
jgi:hypothetical protein